ncbi:MAG: hemerythrin domain-containing protein [Caldimonas sp.]
MATAKKTPAKKTAAKKAPMKSAARSAPAKKAPAKKAPAKKTPARTAPAKKTSARSRSDATALLMKDHKDVKALFKRYDKLMKADGQGSERQALAEQICQMLTVHATIEEEIFYPAVRAAQVDADLLDEAEVEHASAKDMIAQIRSMGPDEDLYDAKVTVLGEYINHHVEEEEGEMFPKARRAKVDFEGLGQQLKARKQELMADAPDGKADMAAATSPAEA